DVGHDADVTVVVERCCAWHGVFEFSLCRTVPQNSWNGGLISTKTRVDQGIPERDRYPSAAAGCTRNCFAGGDSRRADHRLLVGARASGLIRRLIFFFKRAR